MISRFAGSVYAVVLVLALASVPAGAQDCTGVSPVNATDLKSVAVVTGLSGPVHVATPPGDTDRLFIVEQSGVIKLHHRGDPAGTTTTFLDISAKVQSAGNEQGLLSMAFDPDFDTNGFFYVNYTTQPAGPFASTSVSRWEVSAGDPDVADGTSETLILLFRQPQTNHNGGLLLFDDDGFLNIFTGDGGGRDDEGTGHAACGNGQALDTLLGKMLRIDVGGVDPLGTAPDPTCMTPNFTAGTYTVPSDNPFSDGVGFDCDEIFAYGLRNPWRASYDLANGDLFIGDVGQDCQEGVNRVTAAAAIGANYGWRVMEGNLCFNPADPFNCASLGVMCGLSPNCNDAGLISPIVPIAHGAPCDALVGGYMYRGCRMSNMNGTYFYGDNCHGWVKSFELDGSGNPINFDDWTAELDPDGSFFFGLASFGEDEQGELYIADAAAGEIVKILPLFTDFEVSGPGAGSPLLLAGSGGDWTWEDLALTSMHPVDYYRVYRGVPGGTFTCIESMADPEWAGGDPSNPTPGNLFAYIVTGVFGTPEQETSSGDPPRTLTSPCPAPTGCGDGILNGAEVCDGSDLGGETCTSQGFHGGVLACNATCDGFDTSTCSLCGNMVCELFGGVGGEDCLSCSLDCNGAQSGNPQTRFCCGNAGGENPVDCTDSRCTGGGNTCAP